MNFKKLIKSLSDAQRSSKVEAELDSVADEMEAASKRMEKRRQAFDKEAKRGSRNSEHRFSL